MTSVSSNDTEDEERANDILVIEPEGLPQDKFIGPEFMRKNAHSSGSARIGIPQRSTMILSRIITCTSCGEQINPFSAKALHEHPVLHVLICKTCSDFYFSGEIEKGEDGKDEQCRWCADGGRLTVCDKCNNAFCRPCIRRQVSRAEFSRISKAQSWSCFVCDPDPILHQVQECKDVLNALHEYNRSLPANKSSKDKRRGNFLKRKGNNKTSIPKGPSKPSPSPQKEDMEAQENEDKEANDTPDEVIDGETIKAKETIAPISKEPSHSNNVISSSKPTVSLQLWKSECSKELEDVEQKLQRIFQQLQKRFKESVKDEVGRKSASKSFTMVKTLKEFKNRFEKVRARCDAFSRFAGEEMENLKQVDGHHDVGRLSDDMSTTAKESDCDWKLLSTPTRKKLKKRKELDSARASSNETESPIKRFRQFEQTPTDLHEKITKKLLYESETINPDEKSDHPLSAGVSDSGSSKLHRKVFSTDPEVGMSGASLSDIFERTEPVENQESKSKKGTFTLPVDSEIISDDEDSLSLLPQVKGNENATPKKSTDDNLLKTGSTSGETTEVENDVSSNKKQDQPQTKTKKNRRDILSSNSDAVSEASEALSDDQLLPSMQDSSLKNDDVTGDANSKFVDPNNVDEVNRIALANLQKNMMEEDTDIGEDEDVEELLQNKKKEKPASDAQPSSPQCEATSKRQISSSEGSEPDDQESKTRKHLYRNKLLKVRISLSDCEKDKGKNKTSNALKRKVTSDSEPSVKKAKRELRTDEAAKDPNLSDEDVNLLNGKDDDIPLPEWKISDEDVLLSDNEVKNNGPAVETIPETQPQGDDEQSSPISLVNLDISDSESDTKKPSSKSDVSESDLPSFNLKKIKKEKQTGIRSFFKSVVSSSGDEFADPSPKTALRRKRRCRKVISDSDDEAVERIEINDSSSEDDDDDDAAKSEAGKSGRRNIHKIMDDDNISQDTKTAERLEMERRKRLEENKENEGEVIVIEDQSSPAKKVTKVILSKSPLVEVDHSIVRVLKEHQVDGVKFLWRNVIESVPRANNSKGDGCILAHCMGLGKTLQTVAFLHTVLCCEQLPSLRSALVICPYGTILNWVNELQMWLKKCSKKITIYTVDNQKSVHDLAMSLKTWQRRGGVAVCGYAKYRSLCSKKLKKKALRQYREMLISTLQNPGPDIIVCDEGHVLKSEKTKMAFLMEKVETSRRIVLTGTPLQNNLIEYYCMVSFIKPRLLGSRKEFSNRFVNPILNGQHVDSTKRDVQLMKKRSHVLHELLAGCVQRKDVVCLREHLQPKVEYVLFVRLSDLQIRLYEHYLKVNHCQDVRNRKGHLFQDFNNFLLITAHPRTLQLSRTRRENREAKQDDIRRFIIDDDDDEEDEDETDETSGQEEGVDGDKKIEISALSNMSISELKKLITEKGGDLSHCIEKAELIETAKKVLQPEKDQDTNEEKSWFDTLVPTQEELIQAVEHSGKVMLLLEILRLAEEENDKVIVFSQSLLTLDLIEAILADLTKQHRNSVEFGRNSWKRGIDYFRLDGSINSKQRSIQIEKFNSKHNTRARLFLISTKAGGVGVNLIGANRAVLFDASWNPTHDIQSIFRLYRFGQDKPCYIYRLIAQGTMEEKIYDRQVVKQSLAFRVIDEQQIERHFTANDLQELYNFKPERLVKKSQEFTTPEQAPPKDRLLAELLLAPKTRDAVVTYHEHDSLLDHQVGEELTEEERRMAWDEYDRERHPRVKDGDPLLKLPLVALNGLIVAAEAELEQNEKLLQKCQDRPLDDIMLHLKAKNRFMGFEELQTKALHVVQASLEFKQRLENARRLLVQKLEQLRFCKAKIIPQVESIEGAPKIPTTASTTYSFTMPGQRAPAPGFSYGSSFPSYPASHSRTQAPPQTHRPQTNSRPYYNFNQNLPRTSNRFTYQPPRFGPAPRFSYPYGQFYARR